MAKYSSNWLKLKEKLKRSPKSRNRSSNFSNKVIHALNDEFDVISSTPSAPNFYSKSKKKMKNISNFDDESFKRGDVKNESLQLTNPLHTVTRRIALDCEMVGVIDGTFSILARVSIVNSHGYCLYDRYVQPRVDVADYRTQFSGITPNLVRKGADFSQVQKDVAELLKNRILVGHGLNNDLKVLCLSHPSPDLRDTSRYPPFRAISNGSTPSLRKLAKKFLDMDIQSGMHDSVIDAQVAMKLYMHVRHKWEKLKIQRFTRQNPKK